MTWPQNIKLFKLLDEGNSRYKKNNSGKMWLVCTVNLTVWRDNYSVEDRYGGEIN